MPTKKELKADLYELDGINTDLLMDKGELKARIKELLVDRVSTLHMLNVIRRKIAEETLSETDRLMLVTLLILILIDINEEKSNG